MKSTIPLRKALADKRLLGGILHGESWFAWRVLMIAAMGERLNDGELKMFTQLTGRLVAPTRRVEELCAVVGRRGGKSRAMATLAVYIAGLCEHPLAPGERGVLLCIAPDQKQAGITLNYATAALEGSPILRQLIANRTHDTLELTNGVNRSGLPRCAACAARPTLPSSLMRRPSGTATNSAPTPIQKS